MARFLSTNARLIFLIMGLVVAGCNESASPDKEEPQAIASPLVADLALPPEFSVQSMDEFIDWERDGLYVLERGEGECAI